jgi:hypothetical protein
VSLHEVYNAENWSTASGPKFVSFKNENLYTDILVSNVVTFVSLTWRTLVLRRKA